ncbi:hypothetical protein HOY80DRAFT_1140646 [Tuber brumale]|nr:hypothetical protein HOY80DRAFT_1140646 [Tuber brumale]
MAETGASPAEYWKILQGNAEQKKQLLSKGFEDFRRETDMTESILSAYFITFYRIKKQLPEAMDLASIAFFDRQNIPEAALKRSGLPCMENPIELHAAFGKLLGFSLATRPSNKPAHGLHRLVQQSVKDGVDDPTAGSVRFRAAIYLHEAGYHNDAETHVRWSIALQGNGEETGEFLKKLDVFYRTLVSQGNNEAEIMYRRALEGREGELGREHPDTLTTIKYLAMTLQEQGKYAQSELVYRHELDILEKKLGPDDPDTLISVHSVATMLHAQEKYAEPLHQLKTHRGRSPVQAEAPRL